MPIEMPANDQRYTILGVEWFTPANGDCVGIVAIQSHADKWKCYIGTAMGLNETEDAQYIAANGVKIPKGAAVVLFPQLEPEDWIS